MPPTQWVSERHRSRLRGTSSIAVSMVLPVAVKPETLSKIAAVKRGKAAPIR